MVKADVPVPVPVHKPSRSCVECGGNGIKIGEPIEPSDEPSIKKCLRCEGAGVLIFHTIREGEPVYRAPRK